MKKTAGLSLKEFWSKIPRSINSMVDNLDFTKPIKYQADQLNNLIIFLTNLSDQLSFTYRLNSRTLSFFKLEETINLAKYALIFLYKNYRSSSAISLQTNLHHFYSKIDRSCDQLVAEYNNYINNMPFESLNNQTIDPVFKEFDFHGIKFIAQGDISANLIFKYIKDIEAAYELLKLKKLDIVWSGNILLANPDVVDGINMFEVLGLYDYNEDTIILHSPIDATYTILHELGHRFWFKYMTQSQRAKFLNLTRVLRDRDSDKPVIDSASVNLKALQHSLLGLKNNIFSNYSDIEMNIIIHDFKKLENLLTSLFGNIKNNIPTSLGIKYHFDDFIKDFINYVKSIVNGPSTKQHYDIVLYKSLQYINEYIDGLWAQIIDDIGPSFYNEQNKIKPVTTYGETNEAESFAELFAEYVMGKHDRLDRANAEIFRSVMNLHKNVVSNNLLDAIHCFYKQSFKI